MKGISGGFCKATELLLIWLLRHRWENRHMLTLPACCPKSTTLICVPATDHLAALYLIPAHPFPSYPRSVQAEPTSYPEQLSRSSNMGPVREEIFTKGFLFGCQCVLTPRLLPVWGHQLSGSIHHTGDAVWLPCTGNWVGACMCTHSPH